MRSEQNRNRSEHVRNMSGTVPRSSIDFYGFLRIFTDFYVFFFFFFLTVFDGLIANTFASIFLVKNVPQRVG